MTSKEAEEQYKLEVRIYKEQFKKNKKRNLIIWLIVGGILIVAGLILTIIGLSIPPEIDSFGNEWITADAMIKQMFGSILLVSPTIALISYTIVAVLAIKNGPSSFLAQNRNLYLNYLKCVDLPADYKEFYKQKLEEIRNAELCAALNRVSTTASTAVLFSMLKK